MNSEKGERKVDSDTYMTLGMKTTVSVSWSFSYEIKIAATAAYSSSIKKQR